MQPVVENLSSAAIQPFLVVAGCSGLCKRMVPVATAQPCCWSANGADDEQVWLCSTTYLLTKAGRRPESASRLSLAHPLRWANLARSHLLKGVPYRIFRK